MMTTNIDIKPIWKRAENWLRTIICRDATKTCLTEFAEDFMLDFKELSRKEVVKQNNLRKSVSCSECSIVDLLPCPTDDICWFKNGVCKFHVTRPKACPNRLCNGIVEYITKSHRHQLPSWRNTESSLWFKNPWEIAKCFLPPDGYKDVNSAGETDFDGIVSAIQNCLTFESVIDQNLPQSENSLTKALAVSRDIAFRTSLQMTDEQMNCNMHIFESLLTDTNCLKERKATKEAIETIKKVRTSSDVSDMYERKIPETVNWLRREQAKLSLFINHLISMRKEIIDGDMDTTEPLRKKQKTSHTRQLRSADSSNGYSSSSETMIIDKDIHKYFPVYTHACTDVYEVNKTTDSLLCAMNITNIVNGNQMFVSNTAKAVRLIFKFDKTTKGLMEMFQGIQNKVDFCHEPSNPNKEGTVSTIYVDSRKSIQMDEFNRCSNVGILFYGLEKGIVQHCSEMIFCVTNTNDTNAFNEILDDLLERIAIKALQKKTDALVLLKNQVCENTENKRSYELIESGLRKLGFCFNRNMFKEDVCYAKPSTSGTVYKLRSTGRTFFQTVTRQKSEIDQRLCSLKALYARSGVPDEEKPTFPEDNKNWNIEKLKSALNEISNIHGFGHGFGKLNVYINDVNTTQKEKTSTFVGKKLQEVGLEEADYRLHFMNSEKEFYHSGGDKIYTEPKSGTLGAFALRSNRCEERKLCALLSLHVAKHQVELSDENGEIPLKTRRGRIGYLLRPIIFRDPSKKNLDIASAQIDDAHISLCDTQIKDETGEIKLCTLFDFKRHDLQFLDGMPVHIWGASTSPGLGRIKESKYEIDSGLHILIEDRDKSPGQFCKGGDSGSVVCAFHRRERSLIALGMVIGKFYTDQQPSEKTYFALQLQGGLQQLSVLQNATYQLCTGNAEGEG